MPDPLVALLTALGALVITPVALLGAAALALAAWILIMSTVTAVAKPSSSRRQTGAPEAASEIRIRMKRAARTTLLLKPSEDFGFSKLGGDPELSEGAAWPPGIKSPRAFLAQIDLSEVQGAEPFDWLPTEGRLYAFYDEWRLGFSDPVQIVSSSEPAGAARRPPDGLPPKLRFPERHAAFLPVKSTPSLDWLGIDVQDLEVSEEELDTLADMPKAPFGDELQHRVGGYPSEIQGSNMRLECEHFARGLEYDPDAEIEPAIERASKSWRLLLQIDSDPALKMNWGDGGRLYVFIRAQHARAGDFSKTVTITQSY